MKKLSILVAAAVVLVGAGSAVAGAVGAAGSNPAQPKATTAPALVPAAAPIDNTTESKFTPVAPCRVIDTRHSVVGGALGPNVVRNFYVGGTFGFAPQGGQSGGCGVPVNATAVQVTITAVAPSANGFLHVWRSGAAEPSAAFMNYGTAFNASAGGTTAIDSAGRVSIRNIGSTAHLVVDVSGYYVAPMTAQVSSSGALVRGSRVTNAFLISGTTSSYQVDFDRDVSQCTYAASSYFSGYDLTVEPRSGVPNGVYVYSSYDHAATADQFYLTVTC